MTTSIQRRVRNIAISLAHKTGEDADDLTQEGLIAAWQALVKAAAITEVKP